MKKILLSLLIVGVALLSMSCEELVPSDPQVRGYLDIGYNPVYVALGEVTSAGYTANTAWLYLTEGNFSDYVSIPAGSYHVLYDTDSDHSTVQYFTNQINVEDDKKYTASFLSSGFVFIED